MAKIDLKLGKSKEEEHTQVKHYENNYRLWREHRKNLKQPFFMVPSEILDYLSSINSRAINLYLYYCYRANNNTGKSWPAVETAAKELNISTKSVNNWNNELEKLGLIARVSEGKSSKTTYLLPISDYCYFEENITPEKFLKFVEEEIDGKLISIFHLFQWRKEEADDYTTPYNITALVFQRNYEPDGTSNNKKKFVVTKAVLFEEDEYKNMRVNKTNEDFSSDHHGYLFNSTERSYAKETPIIGVAVTSRINLKEIKKTNEVIDLIQQLVLGFENDTLENLPKAELSN